MQELIDDHGVTSPVLNWNDISRERSEERYFVDRMGNGERLRLWQFTVPVTGDTDVFYLDCGWPTAAPLHGKAERTGPNRGHLIIEITSNDRPPATTPEMIDTELKRRLALIDRSSGQSSAIIREYNERLRSELTNMLAKRRASLLRDRHVEQSLNIPIKRRSGAETYRVPVARKTLRVTSQTRLTAAFTPEPALDDEAYQEIIRIIEGSALQMERTPDVVKGFGEEDIRNLILINLNGQLELTPGGEMFNHAGKTDILVREGEKNVFIGECKVWDGAKVVTDGISQLFTYLAWRDTKAAFLLFIRKGAASDVIAKSLQAIQGHPLHKRDVKISPDGGRSDFVFQASDDAVKEVQLAFLPFVLL